MKKMQKMLLALVLALSMTLLLTGIFVQGQTYEADDEEAALETQYSGFESYAAQDLAIYEELMREADERLVNILGYEFLRNHNRAVENDGLIRESIQRSRTGHIYGGSYIGLEDGNLVLLVVDSGVAHLRADASDVMLMEALGIYDNFPDVSVRLVEYAYGDLVSMFSRMASLMPGDENNPAAQNITSVRVAVMENRVVVTLYEYNQYYISLFRDTVTDSSMVVLEACDRVMPSRDLFFEYSNYPVESQLNEMDEIDNNAIGLSVNIALIPGEALYRGTSRMGSVGYPAIDSQNNQRGFVTHGHAGIRRGDILSVNRGGTRHQIGRVTHTRIGNTNTPPALNREPNRFDASFVFFDPALPTNVSTVPGQTRPPVHNETVRIAGTPSGQTGIRVTQARISNLHYSVTFGDGIISDVSRTTLLPGQSHTATGMSGGRVTFHSCGGIAGVHTGALDSHTFFSRDDIIRHWNNGFNLRLF